MLDFTFKGKSDHTLLKALPGVSHSTEAWGLLHYEGVLSPCSQARSSAHSVPGHPFLLIQALANRTQAFRTYSCSSLSLLCSSGHQPCCCFTVLRSLHRCNPQSSLSHHNYNSRHTVPQFSLVCLLFIHIIVYLFIYLETRSHYVVLASPKLTT